MNANANANNWNNLGGIAGSLGGLAASGAFGSGFSPSQQSAISPLISNPYLFTGAI